MSLPLKSLATFSVNSSVTGGFAFASFDSFALAINNFINNNANNFITNSFQLVIENFNPIIDWFDTNAANGIITDDVIVTDDGLYHYW